MPDTEACLAASSDLAESMLLARSSSEELDVLVKLDVLSEPASSLTPTYEDPVDVIPRATAMLKLDWSVEKEKIAPNRLVDSLRVIGIPLC